MYFFYVLGALGFLTLLSFFFKLTKKYGDQKFTKPTYQMTPQQVNVQNHCSINSNPLQHNSVYY